MEEILFRVDAPTNPFECVCIVSNLHSPEWHPDSLLQLERELGSDIWSRTVYVTIGDVVLYRYVICIFDEERVAVTSWETHRDSRTHDGGLDVFGSYCGVTSTDRGWLIDQTEILIKLHNHPIRMLKPSLRNAQLVIKCRPTDMRMTNEGEESMNFDQRSLLHKFKVLATTLGDVDNASFHDQGEFGELFNPDDFLLFKTHTFQSEHLGFIFEVHTRSGEDSPTYLGHASMLPPSKPSSGGHRTISIFSPSNRIIGELVLDFAYMTPLSGRQCDFQQTFAKSWRYQRPVNVGHRGMGQNGRLRDVGVAPENTVASLATAGRHEVDFVEFDVQLTKDNDVVLYHDFTVCLSGRRKSCSGTELIEVPVKDLTAAQLNNLKLVPTGHDQDDSLFHDDNPEDWQLFPSLQKVFESVDENVGFVVEIKYPMALVDGSHEMEHFFEMNRYIDTILDCILKHANQRELILTCFDPDVCSALRCKQNRYPVLFTCQGLSPAFTEFADSRARQLEVSVCYSIAEDVLGVSAIYDEIVANIKVQADLAKEGKLLFVWGDENMLEERKTRENLKSMGVHGVIYDKVVDLPHEVFIDNRRLART